VQSKYDDVVIGAGFSGLAAAIRLADFGKSVLLLEAHVVPGGLNSYYFRRPGATLFNTGLHAFTNFNAGDPRWGLGLVCRNLGIAASDLQLRPPTAPMRVVTPQFTLTLEPGVEALYAEMTRAFGTPRAVWERFLAAVLPRKLDPALENLPTDTVLAGIFGDHRERIALRMPVLLYGGYREGDVPFRMFVLIFRSLFVDGYGSPPSIKHVLDLLVARLKQAGGELRLRQRVRKFEHTGGRVTAVELEDGRRIEAAAFISTLGKPETLNLLGQGTESPPVPMISAVETTLEFPHSLRTAGIDATLVFCSTQAGFDWRMPAEPDRFAHFTVSAADLFDFPEGGLPHHLRIGGYQDGRRWLALADDAAYAAAKKSAEANLLAQLRVLFPRLDQKQARRIETMTPRTVSRYTSHAGGGIYGHPEKEWDGKIGFANLFLAGNDRGGVGIVGAMVSGVLAANINVILNK
jgi:phytoene dehydrogenase-like protein